MSDIESPVEGAATLPDEQPAQPVEQEIPQEPATATTEEPETPQPRDENGRFQKRLNELTRKFHDKDRYAQTLERENAELKQRFSQAPAPDPNVDLDGYLDHVAEQRAQRLFEQDRQQRTQQQEQQHFQSLAQQLNQREAEYAALHPDYPDAASALADVMGPNPAMFEVIATSDFGPAIAHHLGTHLDEAARIAGLPPHLAAAAVARIEARVSAPKPKPTTQTPAPVPTLGGSSAAPKEPKNMSYSEYKAWRAGK